MFIKRTKKIQIFCINSEIKVLNYILISAWEPFYLSKLVWSFLSQSYNNQMFIVTVISPQERTFRKNKPPCFCLLQMKPQKETFLSVSRGTKVTISSNTAKCSSKTSAVKNHLLLFSLPRVATLLNLK